MAEIREYKVSVPSTAIEELNQKLDLAKFPRDVAGGNEAPGSSVTDVKRIVKYWRDEFRWASFEDRLNKLPHFETTISLEGFDPLDVHFIHQKSTNPDALPLLLVHGCMCNALPIPATEPDD
jgi:hypothetical protein